LFIKNERIEMVRYHRILGVMFNERVHWRAHICDAKARALKKINIIKSLSHTSWGSDQKTLLKINRMTILPTIRYGEAAYGSATKAIHHKGVSLLLGTFAIFRVENLLCEAGIPILPEMRESNIQPLRHQNQTL
jgi:hypothetical protein